MPNFLSRSVASKFYASGADNRFGFESVATRSAGVGVFDLLINGQRLFVNAQQLKATSNGN